MLQESYKPREEKEYFGERFLFEGEYYPHSEEVKIAEVKTDEGHLIEVFVDCLPARFFIFKIDKKFLLSTGSGSWEEYKCIFKLLRDDMLGIDLLKSKA